MSAAATHLSAAPRRGLDRVRATLAAVGAAVLGAAPHVLHHVGPAVRPSLRASAAAHEPRGRGHQLVGEFLGLTVGVAGDDTVAGVVVEQAKGDLVRGCLHR
jgi:hypothetical protein